MGWMKPDVTHEQDYLELYYRYHMLENLFEKYIEHVGEMEGVDFIPKVVSNYSHFTSDEIEILHRLTGWDAEQMKYVEGR